jgi:hypothetical protein
VKAPARLGHYTSGTKAIDTSVGASTISKLIVTIDEDGDDDSDRMCVGHIPHDKQKSSIIPGRYSLIRPGEVEEPRGQTMHNADKELIAVTSSLKDNRPTVKSFFDAGRGSSSILQAQNSGSVLPEVDNNTQMLKRESVLFYAYVEQKQHKRKVVLDYLDPPVQEESILINENMSTKDFVFPPSDSDSHLLTQEERDVCIDSVKRLKFIYLHRHFLHRIYKSAEILLLVRDYQSDKHLFMVVIGGALTNSLWSITNTYQMDREKFAVALGYCESRFGTFTVGFDRVPLSNIRFEHLFLLPIRTIMAYLHHHGNFYRTIPWTFKKAHEQEDYVLTGLQTMPVDTAPPFAQLAEYMSELMTYLNTMMDDEERSYEIMYTQFRRRGNLY